MSWVIFTNKLPNNEKYIQFIIDNYNKTEDTKLIYTPEYFKDYLSKEMTSFYELIFIEHILTGEVLASIIVTKDKIRTPLKSKCFNAYYTNFACIRKDYRNRNITKLLLQDILNRFQTEYNIVYGITFEPQIKAGMNIIKTFRLLNINVDKIDIAPSFNLTELEKIDLAEFYEKKAQDKLIINNFPSCSKLYRYFQFKDNYIVLYKLKYRLHGELIDVYYISDSTVKLHEDIIVDLINKLYEPTKTVILNIPEYFTAESLKTITVYNTQEIKICNYISNDSLFTEFDINNPKIF